MNFIVGKFHSDHHRVGIAINDLRPRQQFRHTFRRVFDHLSTGRGDRGSDRHARNKSSRSSEKPVHTVHHNFIRSLLCIV
ncbi:hypothetical protein NY2A_b251L [Paramecium bursaria Chlorella virus NY2A]|uniref:Uncharacterized protein b251L n=1 Tax=Paramecium bursaria Chlorella virus NY2A TaxID=46021 RepID=A7IWC6_PBCVN|nr:hypothetical protein NY2A_b251L [Paramecium bursaria Chlorella virus NY2A]ABT14650.1 hypothetical protein NY2A_b251L [Paramecium bursaria Chlorella virus NY2A]